MTEQQDHPDHSNSDPPPSNSERHQDDSERHQEEFETHQDDSERHLDESERLQDNECQPEAEIQDRADSPLTSQGENPSPGNIRTRQVARPGKRPRNHSVSKNELGRQTRKSVRVTSQTLENIVSDMLCRYLIPCSIP